VVKQLDEVAAPGPASELCPSCAARPIEDPRTGFCARCAGERRVEEYLFAEAAAIAARRRAWRSRTREARSPEIARELDRAVQTERQRRHRLLERTRPREPAPRHTDPLRLADEALRQLRRMRGSARTPFERERIEAVAELIRQLAWGPEGP